MKKKWVFIVLGLFLVAGIGGKIYMDKQDERKEAEKIEVERMSVEALKKRYKNIKSVEIEKSGYNKMTGAFDVFVKMTNRNNESVKFSYTYWPTSEEMGGAILKNKHVQVRGVTTNKVKVIYSNKVEGEI